MKTYIFKVTSDMKQNLIGKIDYCNQYAAMNAIPPKPENVPKKACTYCGYKELCAKDR